MAPDSGGGAVGRPAYKRDDAVSGCPADSEKQFPLRMLQGCLVAASKDASGVGEVRAVEAYLSG